MKHVQQHCNLIYNLPATEGRKHSVVFKCGYTDGYKNIKGVGKVNEIREIPRAKNKYNYENNELQIGWYDEKI